MFPRNAVLAKMYVQSDKRTNHGRIPGFRDWIFPLVKNSAIATGTISMSFDFALVNTPCAPRAGEKLTALLLLAEISLIFLRQTGINLTETKILISY